MANARQAAKQFQLNGLTAHPDYTHWPISRTLRCKEDFDQLRRDAHKANADSQDVGDYYASIVQGVAESLPVADGFMHQTPQTVQQSANRLNTVMSNKQSIYRDHLPADSVAARIRWTDGTRLLDMDLAEARNALAFMVSDPNTPSAIRDVARLANAELLDHTAGGDTSITWQMDDTGAVQYQSPPANAEPGDAYAEVHRSLSELQLKSAVVDSGLHDGILMRNGVPEYDHHLFQQQQAMRAGFTPQQIASGMLPSTDQYGEAV